MKHFWLAILTFISSLVWITFWALLSLKETSFYLNFFDNSVITTNWQKCLGINALRSFNYLLLFFGQMLIIKWAFRAKKLSLMFKLESIGKQFKEMPWWNTLKLLSISSVWLIYWANLSITIFFFSVSNFMGDCDNGDLECSCNNISYLIPVFIVTLIFGFLFIVRIYLSKLNAKN